MKKELMKYEGKFVTDDEYEMIEEDIEVVDIQNCGGSGQYPGATWYVVAFADGEEMSIYG